MEPPKKKKKWQQYRRRTSLDRCCSQIIVACNRYCHPLPFHTPGECSVSDIQSKMRAVESEKCYTVTFRKEPTTLGLNRSHKHVGRAIKKGLLSSKTRCPVPVMVIDCCTKWHNDISAVRRYTLQVTSLSDELDLPTHCNPPLPPSFPFWTLFQHENACISRPASNQTCEYLKRRCLVIMWPLCCETLTRKRREVTPPSLQKKEEKKKNKWRDAFQKAA